MHLTRFTGTRTVPTTQRITLTAEESHRFRRGLYRIIMFTKIILASSYPGQTEDWWEKDVAAHGQDFGDDYQVQVEFILGKRRARRARLLDQFCTEELLELEAMYILEKDIISAVHDRCLCGSNWQSESPLICVMAAIVALCPALALHYEAILRVLPLTSFPPFLIKQS
jgi:hypothetical protein